MEILVAIHICFGYSPEPELDFGRGEISRVVYTWACVSESRMISSKGLFDDGQIG